jgi:hypothetical protein
MLRTHSTKSKQKEGMKRDEGRTGFLAGPEW